MYCLRLFIVVLQELHNVYCYYCSAFTEKYVYTEFRLDWLLYDGHLCLYRNVWPEAVSCCFTRTTLFTKLFTCFYDQSYCLLSCHQVSLLYTFQFLR